MIKATVGDTVYEIEDGRIDGREMTIDRIALRDGRLHVLWNDRSFNVTVVSRSADGKEVTLRLNDTEHTVHLEDRYDILLEKLGMDDLVGAGENSVKAPMPGMILKVLVSPGDEVAEGDELLVLEAMKMENVLKSPGAGTVKAVEVADGEAVEKNQVLIELE